MIYRVGCLLACWIVACAAAQPFLVDGEFNDWHAQTTSVKDQSGDSAGELDVVAIDAILIDSTVHLRLTMATSFNLQAGASPEPDLQLVVDGGVGIPIEVQFRGRLIRRLDSGQAVRWDALHYATAPTVASTQFEIRLDLAPVGGVANETVTISLHGCDMLDDAFVVPATILEDTVSLMAAPPIRLDPIRVASLNTLRTGLFNPAQAEQLGRLLVAAGADVYLLQEEYNSSEVQIENLFNALIPLGKGSQWHAHKRGDNAVVACWPTTPLPNYDTSYSAAVVHSPEGPIVVVSQHPKCCGFTGNSDDVRRIQQAELTAQVIEEVRAGKHDTSVPLTNAPVIIGGDWNLVGSRLPLDRLTAPQLPGIEALAIPNRRQSDVSTWRELDGFGFPPGRLDLIVYDSARLRSVHAEVFDSEGLTPEQLDDLGVQATDSRASDHLMLIADFDRLPSP